MQYQTDPRRHRVNLDEVRGDPIPFPDFDDNLVEAFGTETQLFLESTFRDDRSVLELLSADYTFVNERLATSSSVTGRRYARRARPDRIRRAHVVAETDELSDGRQTKTRCPSAARMQ